MESAGCGDETEVFLKFRSEFYCVARFAIETGVLILLEGGSMKSKYNEWARFCLRYRQIEDDAVFDYAPVDLPQIGKPTEIRVAAKFSHGKQMSCSLFLAPLDEGDPFPVASRYSRALEGLREGRCLLVPISEDVAWTPNVWPATIEELNAFVADLTDSPRYLEAWVMQEHRESNQLLLVVVTQSNVCHGYLLGFPRAAGLGGIRVIPIYFERVSELTRQPPVLVKLELHIKHLETLLKHARQFQPSSDDAQEERRLREALHELANALENSASSSLAKGD